MVTNQLMNDLYPLDDGFLTDGIRHIIIPL